MACIRKILASFGIIIVFIGLVDVWAGFEKLSFNWYVWFGVMLAVLFSLMFSAKYWLRACINVSISMFASDQKTKAKRLAKKASVGGQTKNE